MTVIIEIGMEAIGPGIMTERETIRGNLTETMADLPATGIVETDGTVGIENEAEIGRAMTGIGTMAGNAMTATVLSDQTEPGPPRDLWTIANGAQHPRPQEAPSPHPSLLPHPHWLRPRLSLPLTH